VGERFTTAIPNEPTLYEAGDYTGALLSIVANHGCTSILGRVMAGRLDLTPGPSPDDERRSPGEGRMALHLGLDLQVKLP